MSERVHSEPPKAEKAANGVPETAEQVAWKQAADVMLMALTAKYVLLDIDSTGAE